MRVGPVCFPNIVELNEINIRMLTAPKHQQNCLLMNLYRRKMQIVKLFHKVMLGCAQSSDSDKMAT